MADDYAPVAFQDEDEDEQTRLRNEMYPPVAPPTPPPSTPVPSAGYTAPAPSAPPSVGSVDDLENQASATRAIAPQPAAAPGSTEDLENQAGATRGTISKDLQYPAPAPAGPPSWKDYAPPEKHGWAKLGSVLASLNPAADRIVNQRPLQNAERNYQAATGEFKEKQGQSKEQSDEQFREEQEANLRSQEEARQHPKEKWAAVSGLVSANGEPIEREETSGKYRIADIPGGVKPIKAPVDTATQNKENFQHAIGVMRGEGLLGAGDVTDYKKIAAAVQNSKALSPEEKNAAVGYLAANPTPGTNLQVHIAGNDEAAKNALNKTFEGSEVIAHMPDGRRVQMSYADAQAQGVPPERLVKLNAHEAQENRDKYQSMAATMEGLSRYRANLQKTGPKLSPEERDALRVLTSHTEKTAGALSGILDEIPLAGPMGDYANRLMQGTITSDQYKQLKSPEAKKLVSDYFTSVIDNFASMKARLGSVGRNPAQLQAEINTIPLPYLDWDTASAQFDNKRDSLKNFGASMPEMYKPKGQP